MHTGQHTWTLLYMWIKFCSDLVRLNLLRLAHRIGRVHLACFAHQVLPHSTAEGFTGEGRCWINAVWTVCAQKGNGFAQFRSQVYCFLWMSCVIRTTKCFKLFLCGFECLTRFVSCLEHTGSSPVCRLVCFDRVFPTDLALILLCFAFPCKDAVRPEVCFWISEL